MNHPEVRRRMSEYLEGDLSLAQRALFDAHLDACATCAADLAALRDTIDLLHGLPAPETAPHLADRVVARIQDGEGRSRWWDGLAAFWDAIDPARYLPPLAAAAVTSAVVIVGVRDLGWEIPGTRQPPLAAQLAAKEEAAAPEAATERPAEARRRSAAPMEPAPAPGRAQLRSLASDSPASEAIGLTQAAEADAVAPPGTVLLQRPFGAAAAPSAASVAKRSPEDDLELVLDDPRAFIVHFRTLRPREAQEAWLAAVADRAARRQAVDDVARRLRATEDEEGRALADRFEAVAYSAGRR